MRWGNFLEAETTGVPDHPAPEPEPLTVMIQL